MGEHQRIEQLLERAQRPHILHDIINPPKPVKSVDYSEQIEKLIHRTQERKWIETAYLQLIEAILQLRAEIRFIWHFPKCRLCKANLMIDVERYMGSHSFWWLNLQNEDYFPEIYPDIPKAEEYHIGNYWEQVKWFEKHGNTDVPGENTYQFILDRAKYAYEKVYPKQIHAAREMLRLLRVWDFSETQHREYLRLYYQIESWQIIIPFFLRGVLLLTAKGTVIICPGCPRKSLTSIVASKSWNLQPTHDSGAKLCAKLRVYISKLPRCPKYSEKEKLDYYLQGFYIPTKTRLDELIEYECIQKKHFSLQALTKLQKITVEESDTSFQRFSLKKMAPVSFSLRSLMHK